MSCIFIIFTIHYSVYHSFSAIKIDKDGVLKSSPTMFQKLVQELGPELAVLTILNSACSH